MEKNKTKFKVGDRVRILPSAAIIGVVESEIGKIATILQISSSTSIVVETSTTGYGPWYVDPSDIAPAIVVGQQLLLWEWV